MAERLSTTLTDEPPQEYWNQGVLFNHEYQSKPKSSERSKTIFPFGHQERKRRLYDSLWYTKQLERLNFQPWQIMPSRLFADILHTYGSQMQASANPDFDRNLLRLALCQTVKEQNKGLADDVCERFPSKQNYQHHPLHSPQSKNYNLEDSKQLLKYEDAPAIRILNALGARALFRSSSPELIFKLLKQNNNKSYINVNQVRRAKLYELLPNQFLIGRIWAVKSLRDQIEHHPDNDLSQVARQFELLNQAVRYDLIQPNSYYRYSAYSHIHIQEYTAPLGHTVEWLSAARQMQQVSISKTPERK